MNTKHMLAAFACAAALCGSVQGAEAENKEESQGWNWAMGEGVSYNEQPIVSAEVGVSIDSKFLSYGLVDNDEPIFTPSAALTLLDWVTFNVEAIFDMTPYGRHENSAHEEAYCNRAGRYQELDPGVSIGHSFSADDYDWLPTTFEFSVGYMYEYHPRSFNRYYDDTQFITFDVGLPDLWFEPAVSYERDIDRDSGTYVNLSIGHTFELCDSLTLRPSIAQGIGDRKRVAGYLNVHDPEGEERPLNHGGLMDTCVQLDLEWTITDGVTFGAYVAYSDYIFDRKMRDAARDYEATETWDHSYNFIGGVSIAFAF